MTIYLAEKTKAAIEEQQTSDQCASFRTFLKNVLPHMNDAYRGYEKNPYRNHMGASVIGKGCERATWYGFHWFKKTSFSGRMLRLFNRGHLEEARFIASLLCIGVQIYQQDENGKQYRISDAGGHFGGSGDGVAVGIPDLPAGEPCLLEFKTHGSKYFAELIKKGVKAAKHEHYVQMQIYMKKMKLRVAMYGAVNKDTDEYYFEIVYLDELTGDMYIENGKRLIFMRQPPQKINSSPGWHECKYCDYNRICHFGIEPERNCRTCHFSQAMEDGTWNCNEPNGIGNPLSEDQQLAGCPNHTRI